MDSVQIGVGHESLTLVRDPDAPVVESLTAELRSGALSASLEVAHSYAGGFSDLVSFFASLADDWRGWDGERRWRSLEGDLTIVARHKYQHVHLTVTLRAHGPGWAQDGWQAWATVTLEPGEQLACIPGQLAELIAASPHA